MNYLTHVRGKRCCLKCSKDELTIVVTGPGYILWRETTFIRLSLGLYKQFTSETNQELAMTSTPVAKGQSECALSFVSPVTGLTPNICTNSGSVTLKSEINSLRQICLDLKGQLETCNSKLEVLLEKAQCQPPQAMGYGEVASSLNPYNNTTVEEHITIEDSSQNLSEQADKPPAPAKQIPKKKNKQRKKANKADSSNQKIEVVINRRNNYNKETVYDHSPPATNPICNSTANSDPG